MLTSIQVTYIVMAIPVILHLHAGSQGSIEKAISY